MHSVSRCVAGLLLGCAVFSTSSASAAINLNYSPSSTTVARGSQFTVSVVLQSTTNNTADKATAVNYFLQASVSNVFTIKTWDTSSSFFATNLATMNKSDVEGSVLNPTNPTDLGGSIANLNSPIGNGTFNVATFTIAVNPAAATGGYALSFPPFSTTSAIHSQFTSTTNQDTGFTNLGTMNVTVTTPEPATGVTMFGLAALGLCRRRRAAR